MNQWINEEWIWEWMNQWNNESAYQWIKESGTQCLSEPMNQWSIMNQRNNISTNQWTNKSMNWWINEPVKQWTNEPMSQQINESMNQWINESMKQWINESMNPWFTESVKPFKAPDQWSNESMSRWINECLSQLAHESVNEWMNEWMIGWMGGWMDWSRDEWATFLCWAISSLNDLFAQPLFLWAASYLGSALPLTYLVCTFGNPILLFAQPAQCSSSKTFTDQLSRRCHNATGNQQLQIPFIAHALLRDSRANAFCHNQLQTCLAAASQQLEKPHAQRWHRELDHTNSAPLRFPQLLTFFWLVELSATLPEKTQGFAPESVLSPVNSHTAELLHFPTTWWWVVGMMMWLTWWCGCHDDVVDMMMWLTWWWECQPWQR